MANIVRWEDPFAGMANLHNQLDQMFNNFFTEFPTLTQSQSPAMDVYSEDDKQLVTELHVPGFKKDEVDVTVHNGILEVKGEKHQKEDNKSKKRSYMVRESYESFYRRLVLPEYADQNKVDAQFNDGVLKITVPFRELPKPKKVAIGSGQK